jgi:limonene-1,2-epoxide hydrolase
MTALFGYCPVGTSVYSMLILLFSACSLLSGNAESSAILQCLARQITLLRFGAHSMRILCEAVDRLIVAEPNVFV